MSDTKTTAAASTTDVPASIAPDAKPLPQRAGKRSTGRAGRSGDPRADRAHRDKQARGSKTPAAAPPAAAPPAEDGPSLREQAVTAAGVAITAADAITALERAADHRTVRLPGNAPTKATHGPQSPTAHPAVADGWFRCHGACQGILPASRFQWIGPKNRAEGRYLECAPCQVDRLAANKRRRGAELEPVARPRADVAAAK